jgi:hypothetical protein
MTLQSRQGEEFDRRAQARGVNFRQLRLGKDALITPNPIIHHLGVQVHGENVSALVDPEAFNTFEALIPKTVLDRLLYSQGLSFAQAISPNSEWNISHDNGNTWTVLRQMGDVNRISPVRYHIILVEKGI